MKTLEKLIEISDKRILHAPKQFYRQTHSKIDWGERLICIKGPRGVGKTTVVLQHLAKCFKDGEALYISLDNVWVNARELYEIAEYHHSHGGTHLFLDEVQDCDTHQVNLIRKLFLDNKVVVQRFGDYCQAIYDGDGSDGAEIAEYEDNGVE